MNTMNNTDNMNIKNQIAYLNFELQILSTTNNLFADIKDEKELKSRNNRNKQIQKINDEIASLECNLTRR